MEDLNEQLYITVDHLRKMTDALKDKDGETKLSFEFILTAFFPTAWQSIQKYTNDCYTKGYIQGREDIKNDN